MEGIIIAIVVTLIVAVPTTAVVIVSYLKKVDSAKIGNAEKQARDIIDEALKTAHTKKQEAEAQKQEVEAKKRESLLEVKEESIRSKNELEKEIKERRAEI